MDPNVAVTTGAIDYYSDELKIVFTSHTFHGHWKSKDTIDFFKIIRIVLQKFAHGGSPNGLHPFPENLAWASAP
jgi:hypothetical protein